MLQNIFILIKLPGIVLIGLLLFCAILIAVYLVGRKSPGKKPSENTIDQDPTPLPESELPLPEDPGTPPKVCIDFCTELLEPFQHILALNRLYENNEVLQENQYEMVIGSMILSKIEALLAKLKNDGGKYREIYADDFHTDRKFMEEYRSKYNIDYLNIIDTVKNGRLVEKIAETDFRNTDAVITLSKDIITCTKQNGLFPKFADETIKAEQPERFFYPRNAFFLETPAFFNEFLGEDCLFDAHFGFTGGTGK